MINQLVLPSNPPPTRTVGIWPFTSDSRMVDSTENHIIIRFSLPNYVDGISELDAQVYAQIRVQGKHRALQDPFQFINVTQQFKQNLTVIDESTGLLESKVHITAPQNSNANIVDDMYWQVSRIYLGTGWRYAPKEGQELPIGYYENWTDAGYEIDEVGGQKILTLWGHG